MLSVCFKVNRLLFTTYVWVSLMSLTHTVIKGEASVKLVFIISPSVATLL